MWPVLMTFSIDIRKNEKVSDHGSCHGLHVLFNFTYELTCVLTFGFDLMYDLVTDSKEWSVH